MTYTKTKKYDMSPQDIRIALLKRKETQAGIARLCNVSKTAVYRTIQGKTTSHRIRSAISERTGMDVKAIWPSVYLYGGGPRKKGRPASRHPVGTK